jgi:hypothetical protein
MADDASPLEFELRPILEKERGTFERRDLLAMGFVE